MDTEIVKLMRDAGDAPAIARAGEVLRRGGLVAFPTETVYGLGGNALDPEASRRIYAAKGRPSDNPLIVHIAEKEEICGVAREVPEAALRLMDAFWPGPMTLVLPKKDVIPRETTGGLDTVAVRLPSDEAARALIRAAGVPVAAPSANASGRPSPTRAEHVIEDLSGRIEMILDGGEVGIGIESTIIDLTGEEPEILRPGRITREMIRQVCGSVAVDPAVTAAPDPDVRPRAPGMKYRHYAPKAPLTVFAGEPEKVAAEIVKRCREEISAGGCVGVLCSEESLSVYGALAEEFRGGSGVQTNAVEGPERAASVDHMPQEGTYAARGEGSRIFPVCLGKRGDTAAAAHRLYRALREFDGMGVTRIFAEMPEERDFSEALINRLLKAAGYNVIPV
ncbi:MAG: threonylcarbamoyl-AMP synthase [Lachnospiraceae bacterium]|nr:threonylcarbamoyl-AMP synthase [Lachnospiraceae bacterium]